MKWVVLVTLEVLGQTGVWDRGIFRDKLIDIIYVRHGGYVGCIGCWKIYQAYFGHIHTSFHRDDLAAIVCHIAASIWSFSNSSFSHHLRNAGSRLVSYLEDYILPKLTAP